MTDESLETSAFPKNRGMAIACIILTVCGFSFSMGMTYPVLALVLEHQGFSKTQIGINAAIAGLGLLCSAFVLPQFARAFGYRLLITGAGLGGGLVLVTMIGIDNFILWCIARFFLALCVAGLFIGSEAWMNELVDDHIRGRVMGIYAALISITFAAGPAVIPWIGYLPPNPFLLCATVVCLSGVIALPMKHWDIKPQSEERASLISIPKMAPIIMLAIVAMGFFEAAAFGLLPGYVIDKGFDADLAAYYVAALAFGSFLMQPLIGWLADRMDPRRILIVSAFISTCLCFSINFADLGHWYAFVLIALLGGTTFGAYTLALTSLGRRFKGEVLAAAMACTAVAWGLGGMIGPAVAGPAMDFFGSDYLMYSMASIFIVLMIAAFIRDKAR